MLEQIRAREVVEQSSISFLALPDVLDQEIESGRRIASVSFNYIPEGRQESLVRAGVIVKTLNVGGWKL